MSQEKGSKLQLIAFRSGEIVPVSGIWSSSHQGCEPAGELWLRKEDRFPPCLACGAATNFTLQENIPHVSEDPDFQ